MVNVDEISCYYLCSDSKHILLSNDDLTESLMVSIVILEDYFQINFIVDKYKNLIYSCNVVFQNITWKLK